MNYKISQLKAFAREALRGKYGPVISALLLYTMISVMINSISGLLFQNPSTLTYVVSWIFSFVISLILCIFNAGLDLIYLNVSRGKEPRIMDLFYMFQHNPDRAIVAGLVITLMNTLASMPLTLALFWIPNLLDGSPKMLGLLLGISFGTLILSALLTLPFTFTYFVMVEDTTVEAKTALKTSLQLCKGRFGKLIRLELSFLGLTVLSIFTLYIGLLWIIPYMRTTLANFYREAIGELGPNTPFESTSENRSGDDFHAEA